MRKCGHADKVRERVWNCDSSKSTCTYGSLRAVIGAVFEFTFLCTRTGKTGKGITILVLLFTSDSVHD